MYTLTNRTNIKPPEKIAKINYFHKRPNNIHKTFIYVYILLYSPFSVLESEIGSSCYRINLVEEKSQRLTNKKGFIKKEVKKIIWKIQFDNQDLRVNNVEREKLQVVCTYNKMPSLHYVHVSY